MNLLQRIKSIRKSMRLSQEQVAETLNEITGNNFQKSAISNYETDTTPSSLDRKIELLRCVGGNVCLLVVEPINAAYNEVLSCISKQDASDMQKMVNSYYVEYRNSKVNLVFISQEEMELAFFKNNFINKFIRIENKKSEVILFSEGLENNFKINFQKV